MRKRRTVAWLAAVAVGLMLIPAADAMASKKSEKKQNAAIAKVAKATAKVTTKVAGLTKNVTDQGAAIVTLTTTIGGIDSRVKTIEAGIPQVLQGLTDLKAGLELVGSKLTEAGAALQNLGDAYQAVEYGETRVRLGPTGAQGVLPITAGSADIPDDGNTITSSMELPIAVGAPGQPPEDFLMAPRSAIRSNEADGGASGDPAGYVGGLVTMKCGGGPAVGIPGGCDTDPGAGENPVPAGAVLCVVGPPPSQNITVPGIGLAPFNLVTIQVKAGRTDQSKPDNDSVNPVAGSSAAAGSVIGPLADDAGDGCRTGETGNTLILTVQTQFVDIPTSESPGPKD